MSKAAIPQSKATNAYDLLRDVIKVIREEPRRFDMREFLTKFGKDDVNEDVAVPACGTVGCIAGWTALLQNPRTTRGGTFARASKALGLDGNKLWLAWNDANDYDADESALERLSPFERAWVALCFEDFPNEYFVGTPKYVNESVKRIEAFLRTYKRQLQATKIKR